MTDASYGATLQQPKFKFTPADTTCEQKRIPKGDMCQVDPNQFKKFLEDKCVGRQSCAVTAADAVNEFGAGHCNNAVMQLTAIVKCFRRQMPFKADEMPGASKFGIVHYEERLWGMHNTGVSLTSPFKMRVAFQQSEIGSTSGDVPSFDELDWTSRMGLQTAMVRRLLSTVSIPAGEGGTGRAFWTFKVMGDMKFASMGGMLSIMVGRCYLHLGLQGFSAQNPQN